MRMRGLKVGQPVFLDTEVEVATHAYAWIEGEKS